MMTRKLIMPLSVYSGSFSRIEVVRLRSAEQAFVRQREIAFHIRAV